MPNLNQKLMTLLDGESYLQEDGLARYHAAQRVKAALRKRRPNERLIAVREALNRYRVSAWLTADGQIEFRKGGTAALTL
jgi:hypothetical protein